MYTIHADGQLLFDSLSEDVKSIALSPKLSLDVNKAGSLSFVLPPGNRMHGNLNKLKSVVTVEQDGVQLARGRVMETESDFYNQQNVYCEGDKSFLLDSVYEPGSLSGKVRDFFNKLISNHNQQVDENKRFTVGIIDAVDANLEMQADSRMETRVYWSTLDMIEDSLLNVYGGYLRTRKDGDTQYIDWVAQYGDLNAQPIEFSVNLLDLTDKVDARDVFTVLIPLGACEIGEGGKYTDPLSIASVNGGLNYIQDDAAVAMYGKIWRTKTWSYIEDPAQLLAKGREYLKTVIAFETLTLKAIDMHFADGNVQPIRIGDKVRILSNPHGLDKVMTCSQIEIDLVNPENTVYTFGERPRTLTENVVKAEEEVDSLTGYRGGGGGSKSVQEEVSDIIRWAKINVDETNAYIQLTAGELNKATQRLSAAEIVLDGVNAQLTLAASRVEELEGRTTSTEIALDGANARIDLHAQTLEDYGNNITRAEIAIDGLEGEIALKASKQSVDDLADRVSSAEIDIDGANAAIALKASTETVNNLTNRVSTAESELVVQAGQISSKVSKDGVISSINQTAEEIKIQASKINLSGYVTASAFEAEIATINNVFAGYSEISALGINGNLYAKNSNLTDSVRILNHTCEWQDITLYKGGKITVANTTNYTVYDTSGNPIGSVRGIPSSWSFSASADETYTFMVT